MCSKFDQVGLITVTLIITKTSSIGSVSFTNKIQVVVHCALCSQHYRCVSVVKLPAANASLYNNCALDRLNDT